MKLLLTLFLAILTGTGAFAQGEFIGKSIPDVQIKTLDGRIFNTSEIENDGDPFIITFWALWCKPCIRELNAIADVYPDWQDETDVKIFAISIDDARSVPKVAPTANGNGWEYDIFLDTNGDFKRAMGVNMIPHLFVVDGNRKIVYQHTSYAEGAEEDLYEVVLKVAAGEEINQH